MQNIIFEHLKEDITLIRKEKTNHGHKYGFFEDTRKQRETFSLHFSSLQSIFHPGYLQPKTLVDSHCTDKAIGNKNGRIISNLYGSVYTADHERSWKLVRAESRRIASGANSP